ncbi:MAG TPA: arginine N-succinyltransferase [Polyangia bacterium]|nr:arginine N-succinyltransferase [Polyangia bacterium]
MFVIREAFTEDLDQIHEVAKHLDTVNLPDDRDTLERLIAQSQKSFAGGLDPLKREYLFVLVDLDKKQVIGTSMIHAQHGTRRAPHIFFDVIEEERYSETLDRHFRHQVLRIGYNYSGPTEIGGLILSPTYRGSPHRLGKLLSYVRFVLMGAHRDWFRDEVLSELLPPLQPDGTSKLWESLGRHFTGMTYQEADRISQQNKEFIRALFPQDPIYVCLLPKDVQELIGVVGPETKGVEKMLRKIGFVYAERIDPFDGGPHFIAKTDEVSLLSTIKRADVVATGELDEGRPWGIVAVERAEAPRFLACGTRFRLEGGQVGLPPLARETLGLAAGEPVWVQPTP